MKLLTKTILLVEDEDFRGLEEKDQLEQEGFNVAHVFSGWKAVEAVEKSPCSFDLVLMGINPGKGINGQEAAEAILKNRDIPIVYLSTHPGKIATEKSETVTSYGFVARGSGAAVLIATVKMAIRLHEEKKEILEKEAEKQRKTEESLRHSLNLLKNYVKKAKNAIAIFDRNMKYLYYSDQYIADYNLEWKDLTGLSHYEVFPEIPYRWKAIHRAALKGEVLSAREDVFPRTDGSIDWVNWECSPWYEAGGTIGGMILNSEVVTKRVNEVNTIEKYSAIFSNARWGIIVTGGDMMAIDMVNNEFARMHGYTVDEIKQLSPEVFVAPEERKRVKERIEKTVAGEKFSFETVHMRKDKSLFSAQIDGTAIKGEGGLVLYYAVNVMDITGSRKLQD